MNAHIASIAEIIPTSSLLRPLSDAQTPLVGTHLPQRMDILTGTKSCFGAVAGVSG